MPHDSERPSAQRLAQVLSHYDVGKIESIEDFVRGSRRAPKFLITTDRGCFLLKRRARGKDNPIKVAFAHALQNYLFGKGFPLPRLIGTKRDNNSMLQLGGEIYELFEYVSGESYDGSLEATYHAGRALAMYHKLLRDYQPRWTPPRGSYHDAEAVRNGLNAIPTTIAAHDSVHGKQAELLGTIQHLRELYDQAADQ
ncbi:MAG: phosphotransferase, partial [Phycisphaerae bacterium]